MSTKKLITLEQFGMLATRCHEEDVALETALGARIDEVVADIEGLVATGGEANVLEGVKVNGSTLAITDKMVDLLIATGTENGTISVAGANVAIKGLAKLAYLDEIGESELSEALKASIAAKATEADLSALEVRVTTAEGEITTIKGRADALEAAVETLQNAGYQTAAQVETIAKAAVAASGHAHFEKVDAVPTAENAEENVMYLVMNATTGHYDIYALVGESVELIDDTTVDLSNYSTTAQIETMINEAIEGIKIGDYAKQADLDAAVERIAAVEAKFADYYTKEEAEAKFVDETEANTISQAVVDANTAADADVTAKLTESFGSEA